MELNELIMNSIKSGNVRDNIFPINYYVLKGIYDKRFYKRSRYFVEALMRLFDSFATSLDISIFDESIIAKNYSDKTLDMTAIGNTTFLRINNNNILKNNMTIINSNNINNNNNTFINNDNFSVMNDSILFDINNLKANEFKVFNNLNFQSKQQPNCDFFNPSESFLEQDTKIKHENFNGQNPNFFSNADNLNITINKYNYNNLSSQLRKDQNFYINFILNFYDEHILDKEDDYILLHLIKNFVFSDEDPATSTLLMTYPLFASSLELIFCLKQAEKLPNIICTPYEKKFIFQQNEKIKNRIRSFLNAWLNVAENKAKLEKKKNEILRILLQKELSEFVPTNAIDPNLLYLNTIFDNPLIENYISISKIIKDQTPFYFNTLELARQICLIDHDLFCKIKLQEFSDFIAKHENSQNFDIFRLRDLQLKCYILCLFIKQDYLDKKNEVIKNLIQLAKILKGLKNYQTSFTIISVLLKIDIINRRDIWRSLERYERDLFRSLREEYINIENCAGNYQINNFISPNNSSNFNTINNTITNSANNLPRASLNNSNNNHNNSFSSNNTEGNASIPNINILMNINSYFSNKLRAAHKIKDKLIITKEYKYYIQDLINKRNFKYTFHKVNPIYDFLSFGFIEILRLKKFQNLKYNPLNPDFEKIFDDLLKIIDKKKF